MSIEKLHNCTTELRLDRVQTDEMCGGLGRKILEFGHENKTTLSLRRKRDICESQGKSNFEMSEIEIVPTQGAVCINRNRKQKQKTETETETEIEIVPTQGAVCINRRQISRTYPTLQPRQVGR